MAKRGTGFWSGLKTLYRQYGGPGEILSSFYFLLSVALGLACWRLAALDEWTSIALAVLPTLAAFSIAAYALIFAVLDREAMAALAPPAESLGGRSPLLMLASTISHAVIVQVSGILYAIIYKSRPIPELLDVKFSAESANIVFGMIGLTLFIYGVSLVAAAALSIFRLLQLRASALT